ncbi:MAG: ATP synthase F1 subunit delta [Calditrichaeota bacterium]|nr:ATP synthase F1 subunit delta [Candidatus Cloacimonadota bacterium]MCA9787195.1 ATP synthase F1 subunit delta [Candidatus Cloacimonadota bacterium]MCB1046982.1 ATP synthase F1 subunit delta [Calditrichota bacterium]MCB9473348.1 ATP synthase F1 subunit delta [Candidatus Delongbacteria bacterium]
MSVTGIDRSYGRALYETAVEAGELEQRLLEVQALRSALDTELDSLLLSPKVPLATRLTVLSEVFSGTSPQFLRFLTLVVSKGRAAWLKGIAEDFVLRHERGRGILRGQLESAIVLDPALEEEIRSALSGPLGGTLELSRKVRPDLLGGFTVRADGRLLDASLKARLEALRRHLKAARASA